MTTQHNAADTAAGPHWPAPRPTCTHKLYPDVDFYFIFQVLGFLVELLPVLFAIGRMAGWLAQWREGRPDAEQKSHVLVRSMSARGSDIFAPRISGIVRSDAAR